MISNSLFIISLTFLYFFTKPPEPKFEAQTIDDKIAIGYGLAIGDVNGDGKPDILLADKKQFVWYRNGDWKRFVMADSLTRHDNVCIAARDIDGDGKVEVAVGAQWNPGETSDIQESGSVYYLIRPDNPTQRWNAVKLYHEPTVHRMQWVKLSKGKYALVVLPLHGRGNKGGEGVGVKVLAYHFPENIKALWKIDTLENTMHLTHNFDVVETQSATQLYLAGKEGIKLITLNGYHSSAQKPLFLPHLNNSAGEVRIGKGILGDPFIATIEAMHGNKVVAYFNKAKKVLLDDNINEGHALAVADFFNAGSDQIVVGWRAANKDGKVGIKLYAEKGRQDTKWESYWIDDEMACEDLKIMDLNNDGKPDIVASGRSTHNLKIYWNK